MKKIITLLICALLLGSCAAGKNKSQPYIPEGAEISDLTLYGYDGESRLIEMSVTQLLELAKERDIVAYIGFPTCQWCRRALPELNQAAQDMDTYIYYGNVTKGVSEEDIATIEAKAFDFLEEAEDGIRHASTPLVLGIKNGNFVSGHLALVESFEFIDDTSQLNDEQKIELQNIYKDIIRSIEE